MDSCYSAMSVTCKLFYSELFSYHRTLDIVSSKCLSVKYSWRVSLSGKECGISDWLYLVQWVTDLYVQTEGRRQ